MPSLRLVESASHDPWFNLALEEHLFHSVGPDEFVFYLWRNGPTVVIGRHQNPWVECRLDAMEADGVKLARRPSGGGAVYHDLGNTNFTFACHRPHYSVPRQIGVILDGLVRCGVDAEFSGRNDIVVDDRKVSGSAFFGRKDRWLHHGTLLLDADLGRLAHYLTVPPSKIRSKGVASVRARVTNLAEISPGLDHDRLAPALVEALAAEYGSIDRRDVLDPESMTDEGLAVRVAHFADESWCFGRTPAFTHHLENRFEWGGVDLHLDVRDGVIEDVEVFSDALHLGLVDGVRAALVGRAYRREDLARNVRERLGEHPDYGAAAAEVARWLAEALPAS